MSLIFKIIRKQIESYFNITNDLEDESVAKQSMIDAVSFKGANIIILIFAIFIASLGLNTNSAAVIIGAMLISPLMGPIIGIGLGVGIYDFDLIKRSFRNIAMAAAFSIMASTIYFLISPVSEGRSELLARTSPTIYDVLIGFFGGGAGVIALACRQKGNVIPGVAIATALMPPLCTAGYGLATWQLTYFFGASYLFLINSIFIALATTIGVKLFKFKQVSFVDAKRKKKIKQTIFSIVIVTLLPSIYLTILMLRESYFVNRATSFVEKEFQFKNTQIFSKDIYVKDWKKHIDVTLIGEKLNLDSLQVAMVNKLNKMGVHDVSLKITQGFATSAQDIKGMSNDMLREIYNNSQKKISEQGYSIDSLQRIIKKQERYDSLSYAIAPEIKVLYPVISDISLSRNIVCNVKTNQRDTINFVLVHSSINAQYIRNFKEYIEARTGMKNVTIVTTPALVKDTENTAKKSK